MIIPLQREEGRGKMNFIKEPPKFSWAEITCGEACWSAKHPDCLCSCNGKNHGIWLKGGKPEHRTCKHNGNIYKLLTAGSYKQMQEIQQIELVKYGVMRCYDYYGKGDYLHQTYEDYYRCRGDKDIKNFPLVLKLATLDQCNKWNELSDFKGIDREQRYTLEPALLWEIINPPEPIIHNCKKV